MDDELDKEPDGLLPADDLPVETIREIKIEYHREAPKGEKGKRIHPRRPYPPIPKGSDVPDPTPSPPVEIG